MIDLITLLLVMVSAGSAIAMALTGSAGIRWLWLWFTVQTVFVGAVTVTHIATAYFYQEDMMGYDNQTIETIALIVIIGYFLFGGMI